MHSRTLSHAFRQFLFHTKDETLIIAVLCVWVLSSSSTSQPSLPSSSAQTAKPARILKLNPCGHVFIVCLLCVYSKYSIVVTMCDHAIALIVCLSSMYQMQKGEDRGGSLWFSIRSTHYSHTRIQ